MNDAQLLEHLDKMVFIPAHAEDLVPFPAEELELMAMDEVGALSMDPGDLEPYGRT